MTPSDITGPWIMAMWADDDGRAGGGATPTAWYQTTGTPGSRVFTMEWNDWSVFSINPFHMNWQIKLYEGSNAVQICYGSFGSTPAGLIGIANGSSDYQTLINSASSSVNSSFNFSTLPSSGSILTFTPPNSAPTYPGGNPQYLSVCQNSSANTINSLLQTNDVDPGQTLTWTVTTPATNGSVTTGGTQLSTGGNVTPSGFSYTPLAGFSGSDAFAIEVSDGYGGTANVTIIVTVNPAPTTITGTTTVCRGLTTTLNSTPSGGTWSSGNPAVATVVAGTGVVTGVASGTVNITYTLGSCITFTTVTVIGTPVVSSLSSYVAAPGASITISGNDFNTSTTNNIVYFGATRAVVTSASNTSLTVTVPDNGTYAPVSVTNTTCPYTGYSSNSFLPTYNNSGFVANTVNFDVKVDNSSGGTFPNHIYAGDIDGDGKTDVVFVNFSSNSVVAFRNTSTPGSVSFASGTTVFSGGNIGFVTVGEIDGDGKPEIIVPVSGTASVTVLRNTSTPGTFSFASGVAFTTVAGCNSANIVDIDMDGRPDIVTANQGTTVSVLRNTGSLGSLSFATHLDFSTGAGSNPTYAFAGDVDGDGKSDILSANTSNGTISVFRNTSTIGSVSFAARIDLTTGTTPVQVGMVDLDGDGKLDIVDVNQSSANFSVFPNTSTPGTITTGSRIDFAAGPTAHGISYGDFNGDGKTDVVVSNISSSNASVYHNTSTGTGVFTFGAVNFITGAGPGGVFVVDIDGDGKSDLVTDNQSANTFSILRNKPLQPITGTLTVCPGTTTTLSSATTGGTWSSSNTGIATVNSTSGVVTGVALGTANITYAGTAGPTFTGNIVVVTVTVMALPSGITGTTNVCTGNTTPLSSATIGGVWSTSNAVVATIGSSSGIVSGLTPGVVNITYTVSTGCYVTTPVTVNQMPTGISGTFSVCVGLTTTLTNGYSGGTWTSSNPAVASVGAATGIVTGVAGGNATITYTLPGNCFVTQQVTVNTNPAAISGTNNVCVGGNVTLTDATPLGLFSSSSTGVATIGPGTGLVTGISAGNTNITYTVTATGCYAVMPFTVNPLPATITGTTNVCVASSVTFSDATAGGTWSSSNPAQATVVSGTGVVTGVSAGTPVITYLLPTGCYTTKIITVNPLPAAITGSSTVCVGSNVMLTNTTGTGTWSSSNTAQATIGSVSGIVTGVTFGTPTITYTLPTGCIATRIQTVNPLPGSITGVLTACPATATTLSSVTAGGVWTSNNTAVATVGSGTGVVTGVAAGISTITYTLSTGCFATAQVTINPNPATITGSPVVCVSANTTLASASGGGTWSSSNTALGTIGASSGILTGIASGNPVITYTLPTGCLTSVTATVNPLPSPTTGASSVCVGSTTTLTNGSGTSTWSSSNAALATVGAGTGIVTGVAAGTLNITFTLPTGCFTVTPFTVNPTPPTISGTPNVCVGSTRTLTNAIPGGTWSVSNASATINSTSGLVTGAAVGTLFITYTLPAGCFSTIPFTVNATPGPIGTAVVSSFTPGSYTYVVPAGIFSVDVVASGAQGGANGSGLGGNGGRVQGALSVTPGQQLFVFVGGQGANYVSTGAAGGSSFGGGEDGGIGGSSNGGAGGGAASDVRTSITGGATSVGSLNSRVFVGGGGGGGNFSCSPRLNGGIGGFPSGGNGVASCSTAPTAGSQVAGGVGTCYSGNCGTNGGFGGGGGGIFWGGGGGGGYYGGGGAGEASGAGGSSFAGSGTSGVTYSNGAQTGNGSVTISYIVAVTNVCVGSSVLLTNATPGGVWSSSNPSIATIGSATGIVTGVSAGSVIFSYTTTGNCSATLAFTVNPTPSSNTGSNNVCVGATTTLANSMGGGTWSASNSNVSVNSTSGVVTGVTVGTVDVSYTMPTGCFVVTPMTVNSTPAAITGLPTVCTGQTTTLSSTTGGGTWTSSNTAFATVGASSGIVTGVATGVVTITYTTNPGACFRTFAMTVNQTPSPIVGNSNLCIGVPTPLSDPIGGGVWTTSNANATIGSATGIATGVTVGNVTITYTLPAGCFATLSATVNLQPSTITGTFTVCETFATTLSSSPSGGIWTSSNPASATVGSATGVVSGIAAGTAAISYTLPGGCMSIQQVTVNPQPATITGTAVVCVASTTTLANATFGGTWSSNNLLQATVGSSSGIVTGVAAGNPIISYTLPAGCFSLRTLTVNALPTIYAVTGGGAYCSGGTGVAIGVSNSNTGFSYQLYRGTTLVGSPLSGTGSSLSFGLQTVAGTYTVMATNNTTGCTVAMSGSATVVVNPLPLVFNVTGGGAYCAGGSGQRIFLSGSTPFGVTYQLYIGGSTPVGSPLAGLGTLLDFGLQTTAGTYSVVATITATGCTRQMLGTPVISINPLPTAYSVTITGGGAYCAGGIGQQVGLANSDIGISYQLFNSGTPVGSPLPGTGAALNFGYKTAAGTYTVVGTNTSTTCFNSMTGSVILTVNPLPTVYAVTLSGTGSYCAGGTGVSVMLSGSQAGVNYVVYRNGISTGVSLTGTGSSLNFGLFTTAGTYTVVATNTTTFCTANMSGSPVLSIDPLPTPFLVTGGGAYCSGAAGVAVGLNGSAIGVSYQLYDAGAIAIGGAVSGTGVAISFGTLAAASTYTVVATNASTGCVNNMTGSATITINPLPNVFAVTGGGGYCVGGLGVPVGLATSDIGFNYQLYNGITAVGAVTPGSGGAIAFGNQLVAGTYTVRSTNPLTNCVSVMSGSATVTVNPLPVAFNVTGGGSYCSGGAGRNIGLSNSVVGVDYELLRNGVTTGTIVPGTGVAITFGLQTLTGVYTAVATTTATGCTNNMTGSATISITPLPVAYTVTGGGNYCSGSAGVRVGLSASDLGVNYQLYRGATAVGGPLAGTGASLDYGLLTTVGTYTVVATSPSTTCVNNMTGGATISVSSLPAVYTVSPGGSYCAGGTGVDVTLSFSDPGVNYQLYRAGMPVGVPVGGVGGLISFGMQTTAGAYTVTATNGAGCVASMTGVAVISVNPLPSMFTVTGGGSYCTGGAGVHIGLNGSTAGIEYQLFNGGPVGTPVIGTGLPLDFGVFTATGTYSVLATNTSTTCNTTMIGVAVVSTTGLPLSHLVSGGGNYCAGGSGVGVFLNGSTIGVNYQLQIGSSPIGSSQPGTGGTLDFGLQTLAGVYTVKATNAITGCSAMMTSSASVAIDPLPIAYAVTGGGSICPGGSGISVGLSNSETGVLYQLYRNGVVEGGAVSGIGAAFSFGALTGTGVYTVDAVNSTSGCSSSMSGSTTISNYPVPTRFTVTGGGTYCVGGSGVVVSLNGSQGGIDYQLWEGATPVGPIMAGTGSSISFGLQTTVSTYMVTATNPLTGCTDTMYGSATVATSALPVAQTVTGGGGYCIGGSGVPVGLLTTETGISYQLYNGATAVGAPALGTGTSISFGLMTTPGVYSVIGTNVTTLCSANMANNDTVSVSPAPNAYVVTGGGNYCAGGAGVNIGLSNSQAGVNYELFIGSVSTGSIVSGTGSPITFGLRTAAGIYTVVATNIGSSCSRTMTGSVTVAVNALPVAYTVTGGGGYCTGGTGVSVGLSGSSTGVKYQLYNGSAMVGLPKNGTGSALDFGIQSAPGIYKVVATNMATLCTNDMANTVVIVVNTMPVVYTVTGSAASYCAGGTGVVIYISGSQPGVNYQLMRGTTPVGIAMAGTGTPLDFGPQTVAGTYTVVANNTITGCSANMTGAAAVSINALPTQHTVVGGGIFCAGGSGVHLGLSGSTIGVKYQLYNGGPVGSLVSGTGAALDFGLQATTGTYTIVATNSSTGCSNNMIGSATVSTHSLPDTFAITGGGNYCAGGAGVHVGLSGSIAGTQYQLYYGSTPLGSPVSGTGLPIDFGLQTTPGTYRVEAKFTFAPYCSRMFSGSVAVSSSPLPATTFTLVSPAFCPGGSSHIIQGGSEAGISYQLFRGTAAVGSPVIGSGSSIDFGAYSIAGSYSVVATNIATGCSANGGTTTLAVQPLPTAYSVIGGGNYCSGTSGVHVGLSGSATGVTYQLFRDSAPVIIVSGTGLPLDFGLQTATGNYTVMATNTTSSCTSNMTGSATVTSTPAVVPSVTISNGLGDTVCSGNMINFSALPVNGGSGPGYQWSVNGVNVGTGITYGYVPSNGDIVSVQLTSSAACATPSVVNSIMAMTVLPKLLPTIAVSATPGTIVCEGSIVNFTATETNGGSSPSFVWKKNGFVVGTGATLTYVPVDNDVITCQLTSSYECPITRVVNSASTTMDVNAPVTPAVTILASPGFNVSAGLPVTLSAMITNTVPFPSYQWSINGVPVPGATLPDFTNDAFSNLDIVSCAVTSGGGCPGLTGTGTVTISVVGVGVKQVSAIGDIKLVPNPSKGIFTVKGTLGINSNEDAMLEVTNMLGQVVLRQNVSIRNGAIDERVYMPANIANGMYIVNLHAEFGSKVFHLVIEQ